MTEFPKLVVRVSQAERIFTSVELDGIAIPALRVAFDTGDIRDKLSGLVAVTLVFYADLELIAKGGVPLITGVEARP